MRQEIDESSWDQFITQESGNLNFKSDFLKYRVITEAIIDESIGILSQDKLIAVVILFLNEKRQLAEPPRILIAKGTKPHMVSEISRIAMASLPLKENQIRFLKIDNWRATAEVSDYTKEGNRQFNLVMDLEKVRQTGLKCISRNHQRTIKKSLEISQITSIIDHTSDRDLMVASFERYREAHKEAAGRQTRNGESFEYMCELIVKEKAKLFVAITSGIEESFLYCDYDSYSARGWSQANTANLPEGRFPRTKLEWDAIQHFSKLGLARYHLGLTAMHVESLKMANIMGFKMRFHPELIPAQLELIVS